MDDEQTIVELLQLLVAGNETSSNTLSWAFYLLAKHPEHIVVMREEIETAFGTDEVSYEKIHELSYVIGVLNEAMRLYPPFWMIDRVALGDDQVCDVKVTAGTTVVPYIYGVHKNENIWKSVLESAKDSIDFLFATIVGSLGLSIKSFLSKAVLAGKIISACLA